METQVWALGTRSIEAVVYHSRQAPRVDYAKTPLRWSSRYWGGETQAGAASTGVICNVWGRYGCGRQEVEKDNYRTVNAAIPAESIKSKGKNTSLKEQLEQVWTVN